MFTPTELSYTEIMQKKLAELGLDSPLTKNDKKLLLYAMADPQVNMYHILESIERNKDQLKPEEYTKLHMQAFKLQHGEKINITSKSVNINAPIPEDKLDELFEFLGKNKE